MPVKNGSSLILLAFALSACQSSASVPASSADSSNVLSGGTSEPAAHRAPCAEWQRVVDFKRTGTVLLPGVAGFPKVQIGYTAVHRWHAARSAIVASCAGPTKNIPVPEGYAVDWSAGLARAAPRCPSFTFEHGRREMELESSRWVSGTTYYLYVYTLLGKQLIESYPAGTVDPRGVLVFDSPFRDGFAYPAQAWVGLEIVHASVDTGSGG